MNREVHEALKIRLIQQREELEELKAESTEATKPVELDQARVGRVSRMDAMQIQAMSIETARRREIQLQRIDAALQRFKNNEFGNCTGCGDPVDFKRLEFDPAIPLCIECANRYEESGK